MPTSWERSSGTFQTIIALDRNPERPVVQHRAVAAHDTTVLEFRRQRKQALGGEAQPLCDGIEGAGDQGQVFLHLPDRFLLELVHGHGLVPRFGLSLVEAVGTEVEGRPLLVHHVEIHADLEEPDGGHDARFQRLRRAAHVPGDGFQVVLWGHGQGEPQVVVGAFPGVVVRDAGVLVDLLGRLVQLLRVEGHRHQGSLVAQPTGVEDRAYLPQHVLPLKLSEAVQHVLLGGLQLLGQVEVGLGHHGKRRLH